MRKSIYSILLICLALFLCSCKKETTTTTTNQPSGDRLYSINVNPSSNGTVIVNKNEAKENELITLTIQPNEGYILGEIKYNDTTINGLSFNMPKENVTITVTFVKEDAKTYLVSIKETDNGKIIPSKEEAEYNELITLNIEPNEGYILKEIRCNGKTLSDFSFNMPKRNAVITAKFVKMGTFIESDCSITLSTSGETARADFTATYTEDGIKITTYVKDNNVMTQNIDFCYDDNTEFIICLKSEKEVLDQEYCFKVIIGAGNKFYFQKANSDNNFGEPIVLSDDAKFSCHAEEMVFDDAKFGYYTEVFIGYDLLNTSYEEAYGNLTFIPAIRNTNGSASLWCPSTLFSANWLNPRTYILINSDGSFGIK